MRKIEYLSQIYEDFRKKYSRNIESYDYTSKNDLFLLEQKNRLECILKIIDAFKKNGIITVSYIDSCNSYIAFYQNGRELEIDIRHPVPFPKPEDDYDDDAWDDYVTKLRKYEDKVTEIEWILDFLNSELKKVENEIKTRNEPAIIL